MARMIKAVIFDLDSCLAAADDRLRLRGGSRHSLGGPPSPGQAFPRLPVGRGISAGVRHVRRGRPDCAFSRQTLKLDNRKACGRALSSGVLWASGNYGMLLMVDTVGAGKGFTFSQLALVVNALCGIYVLKNPKPNTRAAYLPYWDVPSPPPGPSCWAQSSDRFTAGPRWPTSGRPARRPDLLSAGRLSPGRAASAIHVRMPRI